MGKHMSIETEVELLEELDGAFHLPEERRIELMELLFENAKAGENWVVCRLAAIQRLVQIKFGNLCPDEPSCITMSPGGGRYEIKVEVPPPSRCKVA